MRTGYWPIFLEGGRHINQMVQVTIQIIEGLERGHVYPDLPTPVTIGREDDNAIRLNDERVSRFHAKIQEDGGRLILTDLDSTNGTRVNGHPVQMRVLQVGDQLSIGRCLLIFGSREEISERAAQLARDGLATSASGDHTIASPSDRGESDSERSDRDGDADDDSEYVLDEPSELFPNGPPDPPRSLRPLQKAEISDFLAYSHEQIRFVLQSAVEETNESSDEPQIMQVGWLAWQRLLGLEMELARYLRKIAEPDE